MINTYDPWLVTLSFCVATLAALMALSLSGRIRTPEQPQMRFTWLLAAGSVMGAGIWSTHFIGTLALRLPMAVTYDLAPIVGSLIVAIIASCVALYCAHREPMSSTSLLLAGAILSGGIVLMHYGDVATIQIEPPPHHDAIMLVFSAIFAIASSTLALRMVFNPRATPSSAGFWTLLGAALVLALAICGAHYIGMAAAVFERSIASAPGPAGLSSNGLAAIVGVGLVLIVLLSATAAALETFLASRRTRNSVPDAGANAHAMSLRTANETLQREIADRRQVEEKLALSMERLQLTNRELEQFAYIASHDLQAPLRTIAGFCQLLQRRYRDSLDAQGNEYIQHIVQSAAHMQKLISGLLEFSRVGGQMRVEPIDLNVLVQQVFKNMHAVIAAREAEVTVGPLPNVIGSTLELTQLLQNLIANGIKFQPGALPKVHISAQREGKFWRISVADQGIGIAQENQRDIFLIFRRLHGEGEYEGSGIGLSICQKIVKQHGGDIWVDSQPGAGATFHFTLKVVEPSQ